MTRNITIDQRKIATATILITESESDAIELRNSERNDTIVALIIPAAFTGTAINFKSSFNGTDFLDAYDPTGNKLEVTVGVDRHIHLAGGDFLGAKYLKLVSNGAEIAERKIGVVLFETQTR